MTTLLFDLFGVIACRQSEAGRARIERIADIDNQALWDAYWGQRQDYDRGDIDGRAYWHRVAAQVGTEFSQARIAALIDADVSSWSAVDSEMVALIGELAAAGRHLGLLSNIPPEHAAVFEPRNPWLDNFAMRAFSCHIGHAKPEAGAYRHCIEALGALAQEILFIDDSGKNVAAAEELGLQGHVFTGRDALLTRLEG
ncbi:MAG: HAD family phosphatase [Acidihalobacter sp.]|jgi:putative hydrolase of the HAD superfamily|uniref:HAD family hydrolase n=1 Tax=Acidihalobacter sp. TaxID=1872108 RepID=UPI00307E2B8D